MDFSFFNRDLSWLSFNERVLEEAANEQVPLLERIKFLSIYSSNLDEFYRVRMPALLALQKITKNNHEPTTYPRASAVINRQQVRYGEIFTQFILPGLQKEGYNLLYNQEIPVHLGPAVSDYFFTQVAGFLQPVLLETDLTFFPENNQLYMAVVVQYEKEEEKVFLVNIPCNNISRFFKTQRPDAGFIIFLEDIVRSQLPYLFEGAQIRGAWNIKITRDAELDLEDEYGEDLAEKMERQLTKRDLGFATRFLYEPGIPLRHLQFIIQVFNLQKAAVVEGGRHHNLKDLMLLPVTDAALLYAPWPALKSIPGELSNTSLFDQVTQNDIIVHTPYHSYGNILRFFNEAATHHSVEEIYTTLYRVASDSKIAHALISAAKNGKKVAVLVELKARFDEANNIRWAKKMKAAGVTIIYSENALKVHAKIALVKRKHNSKPLIGLLSTGNLNETTGLFYTDHILVTAHQPMLQEMETLFGFLSSKKKAADGTAVLFRHLLVAQFNLQARFLDLINREIENARRGLPASIIIKLNNLEEEVLIRKLYEASNAGVDIQLIVRSICCLVPGVLQQSSRISIKRIVDRYLEHGRVFIFHNNGNEEIYLGSADWMNRNIYRRIEVCFPVYDETIKKQLKEIITLQLQDNVQAVRINETMDNVPITDTENPVRAQQAIYELLAK